jgi:hypothetical protein
MSKKSKDNQYVGRKPSHLVALERRIMLDAAAVPAAAAAEAAAETADALEAAVDAGLAKESPQAVAGASPQQSLGDSSQPDIVKEASVQTGAEMVFIDSRVDDAGALMAGINPNAEVYMLEGNRDGVEQIEEILSNRSDIGAIHIVAHGSQNSLLLGDGELNVNTISGQYATALASIGGSLNAEADILIYGCNFAQGELGQYAASLLSEATDADVAASTDNTGHSDLGGDWDLEHSTGSIEADIAFDSQAQAEFMDLLAVGAGDISVALAVPSEVMIGEDFSFTVTFDNTAVDPLDAGYAPFVDLIFPVNGEDGVEGVDTDGCAITSDWYNG